MTSPNWDKVHWRKIEWLIRATDMRPWYLVRRLMLLVSSRRPQT